MDREYHGRGLIGDCRIMEGGKENQPSVLVTNGNQANERREFTTILGLYTYELIGKRI